MVMKIQVAVFWAVDIMSDEAGYRRFGGPYCIHLKTEAIYPPKRRYPTTSRWRWRQHCPPKRRYPTIQLHVVITQKTST